MATHQHAEQTGAFESLVVRHSTTSIIISSSCRWTRLSLRYFRQGRHLGAVALTSMREDSLEAELGTVGMVAITTASSQGIWAAWREDLDMAY
jgi:hypothetical protein